MKLYAEIRKVDDEQRMVYGYASTEALDVQGEVVTKEALAEALPEYMKFGNIREMHQPSAVGVAKSAEMDDKGLYLGVKVVDDSAWAKVKEGVYKGFSIGGKAISKVEGVIKSLRLSEISLVDRPANPEALIEVWKCDSDAADMTAEKAVEALAALLDKGDITPQRLVELANGELNKAAEPAAAEGEGTGAPAAEEGAEAASDAAAAPAGDDATKSEPAGDVAKGYEGEEVWDAGAALSALDTITYLLMKERGEDEQEPEQIKALQDAVAALKAFIASEIQEDNSEKSAGADDDVAKAGKKISKATMGDLQAMHDKLAKLGVTCGAAEKHDHTEDLAKAERVGEAHDELLKAIGDAGCPNGAIAKDFVAKMASDLAIAKAEIEKLKAMPQAGKALLKAIAVTKGEDNGGTEADEQTIVKDANGDVNDAASLIKAIHSKGGVIVR